jgi:hypothetical protein
MKLSNARISLNQGLFLGISSGLVFTFFMFVGLGTEADTMLVIAVLFAITLLLTGTLLFSKKNKKC